MTKLEHSHDKIFKNALSDKRVAIGLIKKHLPKEILDKIDLETIESTTTNFIDKQLEEFRNDMLFKTKIKQKPCYLYLVLEHQSSVETLIAFRLVEYMVKIMRHHLKNLAKGSKQVLPVVIPIIFYNGQKPYTATTNFFSLFDENKSLMEAVFLKGFQLVDFNQISDEILREETWSSLVSIIMKNIHKNNLLEILEKLIPIIQTIERNQGQEYIQAMLKYVVKRGKIKDEKSFLGFVEKTVSPELGEEIMSLAQIWVEKGQKLGLQEGQKLGLQEGQKLGLQEGQKLGLQVGLQEGEKSAKLAIARKMLEHKIPQPEISKLTGLNVEDIEELQNELFTTY